MYTGEDIFLFRIKKLGVQWKKSNEVESEDRSEVEV